MHYFSTHVHCQSRVYVYGEYNIIPFRKFSDLAEVLLPHAQDKDKELLLKYLYEGYKQPKKERNIFLEEEYEDALVIRSKESLQKLKERSEEIKLYNPLYDTKSLYTELIKLHNCTQTEFMRFVHTYGLPNRPVGWTDTRDTNVRIRDIVPVFGFVKRILYRIDWLHYAMNIWEAVTEEDEYKANMLLGEQPYRVMETRLKLNLNETNPIEKGRQLLINILMDYEKAKDTLYIANRRIVPSVSFKDLFQVAYYQLSEAVIGEVPLRRCDECKALFEVHHDSRKFCPPRLGVKRSTCENTYSQRMKRRKKK